MLRLPQCLTPQQTATTLFSFKPQCLQCCRHCFSYEVRARTALGIDGCDHRFWELHVNVNVNQRPIGERLPALRADNPLARLARVVSALARLT